MVRLIIWMKLKTYLIVSDYEVDEMFDECLLRKFGTKNSRAGHSCFTWGQRDHPALFFADSKVFFIVGSKQVSPEIPIRSAVRILVLNRGLGQ